MLASGQLDLQPLISHRFKLEHAADAYALLTNKEPSLGIVLEYLQGERPGSDFKTVVPVTPSLVAATAKVVVGIVGSGNYATQVLIPAFAKTAARLKTVVSAQGVSAVHAAKKYAIESAATDIEAVLRDEHINTVVIATRHDTHAALILRALRAGKHVFVEKPLCINLQQLEEIRQAHGDSRQVLMVGFNRRFAPQVVRIKKLLDDTTGPKAFVMTINAGAIPAEHWAQNPAVGGGRLIGEACHFIDLLRHLAGVPIKSIRVAAIGTAEDHVSCTLSFADQSIGTIHYLANGHKSFPKERLEVFVDGKILQLDNFRKLRGFGWTTFKRMNLWRQDKGQTDCVAAFVDAVQQGKPSPVDFAELDEVTRITFECVQAIRHS
jgi:predicted dehydrogenase